MRRAEAAALAGTALIVACGKSRGTERAWPEASTLVSAPSATAPGAPRPGMLWIPSGVLRAGSGVDEVPRVADAELPGVEVPLGGFYVDVLAWPNEPGAIATTDVTRDDATRLCESKAKRLCSELEWERACKGPDHTRYEYGSAYDARVCGAGAHPESSSQRPSGQRPGCRSGFGARDMHGGVSEWTDSRWGRGAAHDLGVVRGGNDVAGELVTR
jgi:sulfatase modifying factor 1